MRLPLLWHIRLVIECMGSCIVASAACGVLFDGVLQASALAGCDEAVFEGGRRAKMRPLPLKAV